MNEKEFAALLAIEGKKLLIDVGCFRGVHADGYKLKRHVRAAVEYNDEQVVWSGWYTRRSSAVKSIIRWHYDANH